MTKLAGIVQYETRTSSQSPAESRLTKMALACWKAGLLCDTVTAVNLGLVSHKVEMWRSSVSQCRISRHIQSHADYDITSWVRRRSVLYATIIHVHANMFNRFIVGSDVECPLLFKFLVRRLLSIWDTPICHCELFQSWLSRFDYASLAAHFNFRMSNLLDLFHSQMTLTQISRPPHLRSIHLREPYSLPIFNYSPAV